MTNIAFIGLGNMGSGMAANLVSAGYSVAAFDLSEEALKAAEDADATSAASIADAVKSADIVVTMLPAGRHVRSVYVDKDGVCDHAPKGCLLIDCSTIAVEDAREVSGETLNRGYRMVDAPVSGGTAAAMAGTLTFMVGGEKEAYADAHPVLSAMGKTVIHAGGVGNGQVAKIANNMLLGISMIGTSEAFDLAERLGMDAQTFYDIASTASGQCWSMTSYCPSPGPVPAAPSNRDYAPGFAVDMMLKDLRLARDASATAGSDTSLGEHALSIYEKLSEDGFGAKDFSVIKSILSEKK